VAVQRLRKPPLFDAVHADGGAGRAAALRHLRIAPQAAIRNNRRQPVNVDDVVNLGFGWH
jgi:hypothetical protein